MHSSYLTSLREWFSQYVAAFLAQPHLTHHPGILLKREHTSRVCAEIIDIGKELGLDSQQLNVAEAVALFHDLGRFEQYTRHGSYTDRGSVDHAELGVRILGDHNVLCGIDECTRESIYFAVRNHNKAFLPRDTRGDLTFYARLIRDADKLDIWRIVADYYRRTDGVRNEAIEVNLPDSPEFSSKMCDDIASGRIGSTTDIRTMNDFKLLQLGWVYDLNFGPSFRRVNERGYLEIVRDALPPAPGVLRCYESVRSFLDARFEKRPGI